MKIAFVSSLYSAWGGSEELWSRTALRALENQNEVLVSVYDWGTLPYPVKKLKESGAILDLRPNESFLSHSFLGKLKVKKNSFMGKDPFLNVKKFNPDIILISQGGTYDFTWQKEILDFIQYLNKPTLFLLNQYNDEHKILNEKEISLAKTVFSKARKVLFVSNRNLKVCERQIAMKITNADVISNPIKTEIKKLPYPTTTIINFATVGRLDAEYKGQDILIETLSSEKWKSRNWVLNIYGNGKDENYLKQLTAFTGLNNKVHFKGFTNEVKEIWRENHVLILPSFGEGTPLSLLEAMACGRTAVVTDVGGCSEFIEDGYNGFLASAPTSAMLNIAMEKAWEKINMLEEFGDRSLKRIEKEYRVSSETRLLNMIISN